MKAFLEETHLVSVAEFITVRFQLHAAGFLVRQRPVSVAEFITVRFQLAGNAMDAQKNMFQ